jgi:undecaprenyl-diphosphatase
VKPFEIALGAVCAAAAFFALGYRVAHEPLLWIDRLAARVYGKGTQLALLFTRSGYSPFITGVIVAAACVAFAVPAFRVPLVALVAVQIASQLASNSVKVLFRRARPAAWLGRKELTFSYPSGHATTAFAFYGGWLWLANLSTLPPALKLALAVVLVLWIAGICWSRVALGVHYPSDVLGGALLGSAFLYAGFAVLRHFRHA